MVHSNSTSSLQIDVCSMFLPSLDLKFSAKMVKVGLKAFLKTFPTKMKPTKCPAREKNEARKAKKEGRRVGGEKAKSKSQDCCVTFKPKNKKQQGTPNIMMLVLIIHRES